MWTERNPCKSAVFFWSKVSVPGGLRRRSGRCYARPPRNLLRGASEGWRTITEPTAERLWDDVSGRLREALNETTYATWFGDATAGELVDDTFSLEVPNDFTREWIEGHFLGFVKAAARDALARDIRVTLTVREPGAAPGEAPAEPAAPGRRRSSRGRRRVPKYTFDLFVIGSSNRFAHAAALAVAEAPAQAYNPLFIYGGTGLGKTHLLQAIGQYVERAHEGLDDALRDERDVHERLHQLAPRQADRGVQAALPHLRRPPRRRHPVLRGQGADPGGVLPHLQLALRGGPPDRDLVRPAAEGDRDARGAPALAVRVGPDHRHPAARPRDPHRDPAQEGDDRPRSTSTIPRCSPSSPAASRRTSASSRGRSRASSRSPR